MIEPRFLLFFTRLYFSYILKSRGGFDIQQGILGEMDSIELVICTIWQWFNKDEGCILICIPTNEGCICIHPYKQGMCLYTSLVCFAMSIRTVHPSITFKCKQIEEHMSITVLHTDIIKQSLFKLNYKVSIIQSFTLLCTAFPHTQTHSYFACTHTFFFKQTKLPFFS